MTLGLVVWGLCCGTALLLYCVVALAAQVRAAQAVLVILVRALAEAGLLEVEEVEHDD